MKFLSNSNYSNFSFAILFGLLEFGCTPVHVISDLERSQVTSLTPTAEEIESWKQSSFPSNRYAASIFWPKFESAVKQQVARFQAGLPFEIHNPSVAPTVGGQPDRDQEFGLPIRDIGDALSIDESVNLASTEKVLRWFAAKGLYPVNSTKHKCPKLQ